MEDEREGQFGHRRRRPSRLPEWRRYLGLTRFDLVEPTGAAYCSIRDIERFGRTGKLLPKIADYLGVPPEALYHHPHDPEFAELAVERLKFFAAARLKNPELGGRGCNRPEWQRAGRARPRHPVSECSEADAA